MNVCVPFDNDIQILKPFYLFQPTRKGVRKVCRDSQELKLPGTEERNVAIEKLVAVVSPIN